MKKERVTFTKELLDEILLRDNAILKTIDNYEKITVKSMITYECSCGIVSTKSFNVIQRCKGGARCETCVKKTSRERFKLTNKEIYGGHPMLVQEVKNKVAKTCIERYGSINPMYNSKIKEKLENTFLDKYGVKYAIMLPEIQEKVKLTVEENKKNNCEYYKGIQDKRKNTFIQKYGVENSMFIKEIKDKILKTNLEKYGVNNPSQSIEVQDKIQHTMRKFRDYSMPSGDKRRIQGYESFALDELILVYKESNIITRRKNIPTISYTYKDLNKKYFPDIFLDHINTIIEVKSVFTIKCEKEMIYAKAFATEKAGYTYEIWVYDKDRSKYVLTPTDLRNEIELSKKQETSLSLENQLPQHTDEFPIAPLDPSAACIADGTRSNFQSQ
jgi:hypothetical protein